MEYLIVGFHDLIGLVLGGIWIAFAIGVGATIALFPRVGRRFLLSRRVAHPAFEAISTMLLTLPFVMPLVIAMGFDPVWFGIFLVILLETGYITPPVGMNLFVVQGVSGAPLGEIVKGVWPFLLILLFALVPLAVFPDLALWLPNTMR